VERSVGAAGKFGCLDHRCEVQRPVDVREARGWTGVAGSSGRLEPQRRYQLAFVDSENEKVAPSAVKDVRVSMICSIVEQ
jgi:hypothetical protein